MNVPEPARIRCVKFVNVLGHVHDKNKSESLFLRARARARSESKSKALFFCGHGHVHEARVRASPYFCGHETRARNELKAII